MKHSGSKSLTYWGGGVGLVWGIRISVLLQTFWGWSATPNFEGIKLSLGWAADTATGSLPVDTKGRCTHYFTM